MALIYASFIVYPSVYVLAVAISLHAFWFPNTDSAMTAYSYTLIPDHLLGRAMAASNMLRAASTPLGPTARRELAARARVAPAGRACARRAGRGRRAVRDGEPGAPRPAQPRCGAGPRDVARPPGFAGNPAAARSAARSAGVTSYGVPGSAPITRTVVLSDSATADRIVVTSVTLTRVPAGASSVLTVDLKTRVPGVDEVRLLVLLVSGIRVVVLADEAVAGTASGVRVDTEGGDPEVIADRRPFRIRVSDAGGWDIGQRGVRSAHGSRLRTADSTPARGIIASPDTTRRGRRRESTRSR